MADRVYSAYTRVAEIDSVARNDGLAANDSNAKDNASIRSEAEYGNAEQESIECD
jgi:hypothetical protein